MGRLIEARPIPRKSNIPGAVTETEGEEREDAFTRIGKLVPTEIVAGYIPLVAAAEAITNDEDTRFVLACVAFFIGLALTPIYLYFTGRPKNWVQGLSIIISSLAFILWAYLLGGPFAMKRMDAWLWPYNKQVTSFIVLAYTWVVGLLPYDKWMTPPHPGDAEAAGR